MSEEDLDLDVAEEIKRLRQIVENANKNVQKQSDEILSSVVNNAIGFGYPNIEELKLGVTTQLSIDDQIKNQTKLSYISGTDKESLPSTHNGLGYKNLIKIEFLLAAFAKDIEKRGVACIPILFIEEPESHMHPQMQTAFAKYLEEFLSKISFIDIQILLTSHSAHIANSVEFSKIRYAQKAVSGVIYKNLNSFVQSNSNNVEFIRKYLTLTRCDLFFADKVILVEGASERLLLPDMIEKCEKAGEFDSRTYKLSAQYYTLIEIGGAYAYKFIPFVDFLGIPCLILTDLDSVLGQEGKNGIKYYKSVSVCHGETTSNETIKWWVRKNKGLADNDASKINLSEITSMSPLAKSRNKCHIEFQTTEAGLCGHSLEEAIRNVNRAYYHLDDDVTEDDLEFAGNSKTDFALDLIYACNDYVIPAYIKSGLVWLNDQKVLE
jgi:predicted ATP-dependent endonuclease of OLD family